MSPSRPRPPSSVLARRARSRRRPAVAAGLAALAGVALGAAGARLVAAGEALPAASAAATALVRAAAPLAAVGLAGALALAGCALAGRARRPRERAPGLAPPGLVAGGLALLGLAYALRAFLALAPAPAGLVGDASPRSRAPAQPVVVRARLLLDPAPAPWGGLTALARAGDETLRLEGPRRAWAGRPLPGAEVVAVGRVHAPPARRKAAGPAWTGPAPRVLRAVEVRAETPGSGPRAWTAAIARSVGARLDAGVAPARRGFFRAVLLGERGGLDAARREAFRRTSTAHLLAVSGLHVSLLAALALGLGRAAGLSRGERAALAATVVLGYVALVGARAPATRAAAAGLLVVAAPWRGDAWTRLATGWLVVAALDPAGWAAPGTVLSFGTVAGLLALGGPLGAAGGRLAARCAGGPGLPARPGRRPGLLERGGRALGGWLAAWLASSAVLVCVLGEVSLVALALNPPAIALFGVVLGLGAGGAALAVVAPWAGGPLLALADAGAALLFALIDLAARAPGHHVVARPAALVAVLAAGAGAWALARRDAEGRWGAPARAALLLAALGLALACGGAASAPP